jgi:transcriptional regulator with XRE-family HTH domain
MDATTPDAPVPFGDRLRTLRTRQGMTSEVLGGLVGKSGEWVRAVESGRLQQPKLPMLIRLAEVLRVRDLAELAGVPESALLRVFAGPGHPALPAVRDAINAAPWGDGATPPEPLDALQARLAAAWQARHAAPDHRTVLGAILPALIRDAQRAVRAYDGEEGRRARAVMAGVWNLTQFFLAYQPDSGLLWRVAERGMAAAMESGDLHAVGGAVWLLAQAHRDAGEFEAAESVNRHALELLGPAVADGDHGLAATYGALLFEVAYTAARAGSRGEAWGFWDQADAVARRLPPGFYDPMTSFSRVIMGAHAVTVAVEGRERAESVRQARRAEGLAIPSQPRRGRHLIEAARAWRLSGDEPAVLGTLQAAYATAPETIRYNGYARQMTAELAGSGAAGVRREAAGLAQRLGIPA